MIGRGSEFDIAALERAFEDKDFEGRVSSYAEWIEYRHFSPPRPPNRMVGK